MGVSAMGRFHVTIGFILGSAFAHDRPLGLELVSETVDTPFGSATLHRVRHRDAVIVFRHGLPHRWLPNQIPYRAHAWALAHTKVRSLVITSSVGVLDPTVPLHVPLLVEDVLMLDNRLPDGSACTMFVEASAEQGHLVLGEGLCSRELDAGIAAIAEQHGQLIAARVVFAYAQGPRTKTSAENRVWRQLGAHVNSMTVGPELVLANELEIASTALVIGHKYSVAGGPGAAVELTSSLDTGRRAFERLIGALIDELRPVAFANHIHRFA